MTENEIYRDWKQSKDPAKQVKILADINRCKPAEIAAIISKVEAAQNQTVPAEPVPVKSSDDPDKRLIELYRSGATYKEMAAALSVPFSTIKYHIKKLTDSGKITNRVLRKNSNPERPENAPVAFPADDMMQWLEVLRTCVGMVEGGAKITHICVNDGAQAEVGFTANGNTYLLRLEARG